MSNINAETGIRFGVIAMNSIDGDLVHELYFGPNATDEGYEEAYKEAKADAQKRWDDHLEDAHIAAFEVDAHMSEKERERFIEKWFDERGINDDQDEFVDLELERFSDMYESDNTSISGTYEGVTYGISSLGGAGLLWVFQGPEGACNSLCSPCVPNAGDLDSGFTLDSEIALMSDGYPERDQEGYPCYCVPRDWLRKEG